jgi:hypothetical protein
MTDDQATDAPGNPVMADPQPAPASPPPLTAIELVAEAIVEIHAMQPELATQLRDELRRCTFRELACLFGAQAIVDTLLTTGNKPSFPLLPDTMPSTAAGAADAISVEGATKKSPRPMARPLGPRRRIGWTYISKPAMRCCGISSRSCMTIAVIDSIRRSRRSRGCRMNPLGVQRGPHGSVIDSLPLRGHISLRVTNRKSDIRSRNSFASGVAEK